MYQTFGSPLAQFWWHQKSKLLFVGLLLLGIMGAVALGPFFPLLVLAILPLAILLSRSKEETEDHARSQTIDWAAWQEILGTNLKERHRPSDFFYIGLCLLSAFVLGPFVVIPLTFAVLFLMKKAQTEPVSIRYR